MATNELSFTRAGHVTRVTRLHTDTYTVTLDSYRVCNYLVSLVKSSLYIFTLDNIILIRKK